MKPHLTLIRPDEFGAPFVAPPRSGLGAKKGSLCTFLLPVLLCLLLVTIAGPARADDDLLEQTRKNNERLYELKREREQRLADFVGGVYGSGGVVIDDTTALTDDGLVIADGKDGFITRRGYYSRNGDVYSGGGGIVVQDGDLFYGDGVKFRSGQVYFGGGGGSSIVVSPSRGVSSTMRRP